MRGGGPRRRSARSRTPPPSLAAQPARTVTRHPRVRSAWATRAARARAPFSGRRGRLLVGRRRRTKKSAAGAPAPSPHPRRAAPSPQPRSRPPRVLEPPRAAAGRHNPGAWASGPPGLRHRGRHRRRRHRRPAHKHARASPSPRTSLGLHMQARTASLHNTAPPAVRPRGGGARHGKEWGAGGGGGGGGGGGDATRAHARPARASAGRYLRAPQFQPLIARRRLAAASPGRQTRARRRGGRARWRTPTRRRAPPHPRLLLPRSRPRTPRHRGQTSAAHDEACRSGRRTPC
jgi:hypothetical protein